MDSDQASTRRVVLLGASNLTLAFPRVVRMLRSRVRGRLEVFAARGHGRSYGDWSYVLFRGLPGIVDCHLWKALRDAAPTERPELALVTDVGNDLLYGFDVPRIAGWVETCLSRLAERQARLVLTLLPLASVERLPAWRFRLVRRLLFPKNRMTFEHLLGLARELNERLIELGQRFGAQLVEPPARWYGFDPIHVRPGNRAKAWEHILSSWDALATGEPPRRPRGWSSSRLRWLRPRLQTMCGRIQRTPQPALELPDGGVWLY